MESLITYAIYIHAFLGGVGLVTGIGSIVVKKGGRSHKKMGKLFSIGMIGSSLISLPIACMPGHKSLFLFVIGVFTIYLVLVGNRSLTFKSRKKQKATPLDLGISMGMLLFSTAMLVYGIYGLIYGLANNILFFTFGFFGMLLTVRDFMFYKKYGTSSNEWLLNHITKMLAALIASFTAFIVAGLGIGTLLAWILPSIIGTVLIIYWRRKMKV
ncbi:MAG: hypothetical protein WBG48_03090 [Pricia sp.]